MELKATRDFAAHVDGEDVEMNKGDAFGGSERAGDRLKSMGLLEPETKRQPAKKGEAK